MRSTNDLQVMLQLPHILRSRDITDARRRTETEDTERYRKSTALDDGRACAGCLLPVQVTVGKPQRLPVVIFLITTFVILISTQFALQLSPDMALSITPDWVADLRRDMEEWDERVQGERKLYHARRWSRDPTPPLEYTKLFAVEQVSS